MSYQLPIKVSGWWHQCYINCKWFGWQLILTLSTEKSWFSSKKLERLVFVQMAYLISFDYYWLHRSTINVMESIALAGTLLGYAGYALHKSEKAKDKNSE